MENSRLMATEIGSTVAFGYAQRLREKVARREIQLLTAYILRGVIQYLLFISIIFQRTRQQFLPYNGNAAHSLERKNDIVENYLHELFLKHGFAGQDRLERLF